MGWRPRVDALLAAAPAWMRALASAELHIGGMTNVQLAHPVLDVGPAADEEAASRAVVFFVAACAAHDAALGRVCCPPAWSASLADVVRARLGTITERVDDECASLMGYFDVYLRGLADDDPAGGVVEAALEAALVPERPRRR
jgi:hypothetical protein